jgi:hypothetical protein
MGLKQCAKCSEMVDEAKAFCPGCGHAFVEEEHRQQKSEFERLDNTVQFGQTMYNQMLSEMGLNISKTPPPDKRVEVIAPSTTTVIKPAVAAAEPSKPAPASEKQPGSKKWYILGGVLVVIIIVLTLAATALLYALWTGYKF